MARTASCARTTPASTRRSGLPHAAAPAASTGSHASGPVHTSATAGDVAQTIDAAERKIRAAEPMVTSLYLEPDIYRADYVPAERPEAPAPAGH